MFLEFPDDIKNKEPKLLEKKWHTDLKSGFLLRQVYGETERFVYHTHDYYELFLTVSNTITHFVNGKIQVLEPGCLVFIRPSDKHLFVYHNEKNYAFVNLALDPSIVDGMLNFLGGASDVSEYLKASLPPVVRLSAMEKQAFLKKIDDFNAVSQEDVKAKKLKIRSFLLDTFINYFMNRSEKQRSEIPLWLEVTYEKMKKPANFISGIKRMVEISGKTQEYLSRSVKKYYNTTLSEFINELRLNYAVNLIVNTNLKITDICYESGFGNISSFYTLFRKNYGMSPKRFREIRS
ncbi:MAG: helix-turn-helix domain-containing protein [Clostridia bacterium]|nr:helix-turn-helix domain-containing protein [Clostridia bacterium]